MKVSTEKLLLTDKQSDGRNYGVDLLRMVSMYMIILLHVVGLGEILKSTERFSGNYYIAWLIQLASLASVNVFAITSGYVYYGKNAKYANLIQLLLQMLFYSVLTTAVYWMLFPGSVTKHDIADALLPFRITGYWYFSCYFCLFFFIPYLSRFVEQLNAKSAVKLLCLFFVLFSLLPAFLCKDTVGTSYGYSVMWLAVLYIVGACIRKYDVDVRHRSCLLYYLLCVLLSLVGKTAVDRFLDHDRAGMDFSLLFCTNISPAIVLSSVFLFLYFRKIHLNKIGKAVVRFFAPMTFGVYLLHMEPLIKLTFITGRFGYVAGRSMPTLICTVFLSASVIWLACSLTDRVRMMIFEKLKIVSLCARMEGKARALLSVPVAFLVKKFT